MPCRRSGQPSPHARRGMRGCAASARTPSARVRTSRSTPWPTLARPIPLASRRRSRTATPARAGSHGTCAGCLVSGMLRSLSMTPSRGRARSAASAPAGTSCAWSVTGPRTPCGRNRCVTPAANCSPRTARRSPRPQARRRHRGTGRAAQGRQEGPGRNSGRADPPAEAFVQGRRAGGGAHPALYRGSAREADAGACPPVG